MFDHDEIQTAMYNWAYLRYRELDKIEHKPDMRFDIDAYRTDNYVENNQREGVFTAPDGRMPIYCLELYNIAEGFRLYFCPVENYDAFKTELPETARIMENTAASIFFNVTGTTEVKGIIPLQRVRQARKIRAKNPYYNDKFAPRNDV